MCRFCQVIVGAVCTVMVIVAPVESASPRLARFVPGCVSQGRTVELTLEGERMNDPLALHFYEPGIEAIDFKLDGDALRVKLKIDPDCRIGEHVGHLRTRTGITEYRPLYVIPFDTENEQENNNTVAQSQVVALNKAYCGRVTEGDRDLFAIDITKPTVLNIEMLAMRLGNTVLDSVVTLLDDSGKTLTSSTGHRFSVNDPILHYELKDPGRYFIEVRELLSAGNEQSHYVLCIGDYPRPLALFPPGGPLGKELSIECRGDVRGIYHQTVITPDQAFRHHSYAPSQNGLQPPTPIPFRLSKHSNLLETEPNGVLSQSNRAEITKAFCGTISKAGDEDWFQFNAEKDETLDIDVYARRVRSSLDSVISIFDNEGKMLVTNDDGGKVTDHSDAEERGADSFIRFNPPETTSYYLRISDILGTGSATHVYRIECAASKPWMLIRLPRVQDPNELYGQYRQQIFVARGNRFAALARARTRDFSGRLQLQIPQLPEGVSYETQNIPAGTTGFPIVFTAAEDAPLGGGLYAVRGSHEDPDVKIEGGYYNYADLLRAKENLSLLKTRIVEKIPIVVTESIPYQIEGVSPGTPIIRSGIWKLKVKVSRDEGFDAPIRLTMPFLPPGISTSSGEVIPAGESEAEFRLTAHPKITPRDWKLYVQGVAGKENNWIWASTQMIPLEVQKGFASLTFLPAESSVGQETTLGCEIDLIKEFEGEARIELTGLPENVESSPVVFKPGEQHIGIPLRIHQDAAPGTYQGIRATLNVPYGNQVITSQFGPTTLVIQQDSQVATEPVVVQSEKEAAKPLSRLEQLRLEAKARRADVNGVSP